MASRKRKSDDPENPEWTAEDFSRARPAEEVLSPNVLRAFKGRGSQIEPKKIPVSLRLSPVVVNTFRASGKGWQSRLDGLLIKVVKTGKLSKADVISLGPKAARNARQTPPPKQAVRVHGAKKA